MMIPDDDRRPAANAGSFDPRLYYVCQVLGWGLYGAVLSAGRGPGRAATLVAWCACGAFGTHLLRLYTKRHPWRKLHELGGRIAWAVALVPALMAASQPIIGK